MELGACEYFYMKNIFKKLVVFILTWEARVVLRRYTPSVIAVTGSVGKTSTKDAIYALLSAHAHVRRSEKSFNSAIGVPLSILGRPNAWDHPGRWLQNALDGLLLLVLKVSYPDWLVLEIGADRPGDIREIVRWLPVDIAVITRLPEVPVHVEFFESPEEVAAEKAALIQGLKPSGTLLLCADDIRVAALRERAPAGCRVLTFGFSESADVRADVPELVLDATGRAAGMKSRVYSGGETAEIVLRCALGAHMLTPVLAAAAVAVSLGMDLASSMAAIERNYEAPPGRMRLLWAQHDALIIDDSYNSSPVALEGALKTLAETPARGRKYAVIGDMMELGRYSTEEHKKAGVLAGKCLATRKRTPHMLITVGIRARDAAVAAQSGGLPDAAVLQFEDSAAAGEALARMLKAGDVVLIKGSQSMRMERAVKLIMAQPERAPELLVRQDREWNKR